MISLGLALLIGALDLALLGGLGLRTRMSRVSLSLGISQQFLYQVRTFSMLGNGYSAFGGARRSFRGLNLISDFPQRHDGSDRRGAGGGEEKPVGIERWAVVRLLCGVGCFYGGLSFAYRSKLRSDLLKFLLSFLIAYTGVVLGLWDHLWAGLR